jgi:ribA/ribD-fused uncharacterized protein
VVFYKTREAFGELSNMASGYPLKVAEINIPSTEALYQACRFPHLPEVQRQIIAQKSPMTAKMVSKPYRDQSREDWDDIRVAVMKWCLRVKLQQHWSRFSMTLLATGNSPIIEQSRKDPFWGAIPDASQRTLVGANVLGRLLMELRSILRERPVELNEIKPLAISDFLLLGRPIDALRKPGVESTPKLRLVHSSEPMAGSAKESSAARSEQPAAPKKATTKAGAHSQLSMMELPKQRRQAAPSVDARYHVVASKKGGWDVLKLGAKRATGHFQTKAEATKRGRELAQKQKLALWVYDKAGKIQERHAA